MGLFLEAVGIVECGVRGGGVSSGPSLGFVGLLKLAILIRLVGGLFEVFCRYVWEDGRGGIRIGRRSIFLSIRYRLESGAFFIKMVC